MKNLPSCGHVASTQPQKMFRSHFMSLLGQERLRNAQKWKTLEQNHFLLSNTKICDILNAVIFVVAQLSFLLTVNHRSQYRCIESLISKLEACETVRFNLVQNELGPAKHLIPNSNCKFTGSLRFESFVVIVIQDQIAVFYRAKTELAISKTAVLL